MRFSCQYLQSEKLTQQCRKESLASDLTWYSLIWAQMGHLKSRNVKGKTKKSLFKCKLMTMLMMKEML